MPGLSSARVPIQIRLFVAVAVTGALLIHLWDQIVPFAIAQSGRAAGADRVGNPDRRVDRADGQALRAGAAVHGAAIAMLIGFGGIGGAGIDEPDPQAALGA